ncbi:MAG TPA: c-type cytochrome biogenesis protein CcsB [Deltaproteobacteria bacterium]|nr:MAG: c-type cytochrome biogenesis protein CcsB [Deltaproteobacteria bacterium GWA2_65_63]OGP28393.1 MAG: c-type cytochrome biogenesis protein CcsB [Deltaproteobacteria bacterium GWB2_65_81]OGP36007.1 MAG: c-type cytochrome biogenesis protein CcsB [Deltaproteobacteria bacterium GWC2_66_88]OGP78375.1 MAG: c-type cytochrome biogenesis protein CcsB [Deltaproteobacteria bacterium RBG_16_66_15]HAM32594.1 c-type cytochrome biogenesis protein CcsB [Deltaproteobacteria bacterium]
MHTVLLKVTALFYLVGALAYLHFIFTLNERSPKLGRMLLLIGVVLHGAGFVARYFVAGYTPITSLFESLTFFAFAIVAVFLAFELRYNLRVLGAFVAPLAFAFSVFAAFLPGEVRPLAPALNSYWLPVHVILLFFGNAVFAVAFGAAIMYLLMEKELKTKKMGAIFKRLPSLDVLDDINYRCLTIGFPLLTLGIITGSIWAEYAWGSYWSWDPKEVWSLITWLLYAALLHGRLTVGWRGRKAAILAIAGFCAVLFTFLGVNLLLPGLHTYTNLSG